MTMDSSEIPCAESECLHCCQSKQHGAVLTSALSLRGISGSATIAFIHWLCSNCGQVVDTLGRTALHVAASRGCCDVARWLVRHCSADVNLKDTESGYTPLHRSLFYGQIHAAISLIQLGANVSSLDYDDLTALDHAMKDRMPYVEFNLSNPCEVYAWGTNSNYTLGIGNPRNVPEIVDFFRKQNTSVRQVSMNKFHSIFVTHDGRAFSCGHGQGGRLGLQSEKASLLPCQMKLTSPTPGTAVHVVAASLGRDHTVLLSEGGIVWTCGLNSYHQLGHSPPPTSVLTPRALIPKIFRPVGDIQGVCAGRFHTVVWGPKGIMTFGLHAGQLGHGKGPEMLQTVPRLVSAVSHKEAHIIHVAASDGATVVVTKKGDIYSLHEYQCRKIATRLLDVVKVVVVGGHLDCRVDTNTLIERGGDQLRVAVLTKSGKLFLWQESSQQMLRCIFSMRRPLLVADFALCRTNFILFATHDGEAFEGEIRVRKPKKAAQGGVTSPSSGVKFHEFLEKSDCEQVKAKRLLHIHRAVSVSCDPKGRNYAIVQTHPQAALLAVPAIETSEISDQMKTLLADSSTQDSIHDVVFLVGSCEFPAHRFVVASRSEPLAKLMESKFVDSEEAMRVKVNIKSDIFELILQYIYSGDCDMLKSGVCHMKGFDADSKENEEFLDLSNVSAYEVYSADNNCKKIKNKQKKKEEQQQQKKQNKDPVKILQDAARKFGLMSLYNELSHVKYENGIFKIEGQMISSKIKFDREKHSELCDVTVKSEDGVEIKAHKCILTSRLEYFNSILNHGWLESSQRSKLHLPVPHKILQILIDFLYEDESPLVQESEDLDLVFSVLVVADQFFVTRLKEICEVTLSSLITLRNAAKILQLADTYNTNQLKQCCMQYICLNLSAILEMRGLEFVDDSVLEELTKYYQDFNPIMSKRVITPYSDAPSQSLITAVAEAYPVKFVDSGNADEWEANESSSKKNTKAVRKKVRIRKISGNDSNKMNERMRNESLSSNHSVISDEDEKQPLNFSDLIGRPNIDDVTLELRKLAVDNEDSSSQKNSQWVKITASQKKRSAKHILAAIKVNGMLKENPSLVGHVDDFTTLTPESIHTQQHQSASIISTKDSTESVTPNNNSACFHSPPPDLISDFPELNLGSSSSTSQHDTQPKISHKSPQVKNYTKISQKQRKKMAAELIEGGVEKGNIETPRISWGLSSEPSCSSLSDIIREETKQSRCASTPVPIRSNTHENSSSAQSPPAANAWSKIPTSPLGSPESIIQFSNIVADEKKQRINLSKMRAKPLELTQLEDRAIEDLLSFYNASTSSDERITVHRVITDSVATPTWITSHH